jgi:AraC family transcriptional regulator of adaptative response/methylated-DNA-[protein]-cysteine methyltransferase
MTISNEKELVMHTENLSLRFAIGDSQLGLFAVAVSAAGIAALIFGDSRDQLVAELGRRFAVAPREDHAGLAATLTRLTALIANPGKPVALSLDPHGTAFQRQVWDVLRQIPAGRTLSYGEVASRIGAPRAMRAVAQACGATPIAIAIPCHRVVRGDGSIGGYRWGIERKTMLLRAEAAL